MFTYIFKINDEVVSRFENKWPAQPIKLFNECVVGHIDKKDAKYEMFVTDTTGTIMVAYTNNQLEKK